MAWAGAVASIGLGAIGDEQQREATLEGAQDQAYIEALNRAYQRRIFDENIENQRPYYEAGTASLPMLEQFRTQGGVDLSNNPLYRMQQQAGMEGLRQSGHTRPGTRQFFQGTLNATSQQPAYDRLLDLQRVGLGQAGAAGNYGVGLGNALASSYQTAGNSLAQSYADAGRQRQGLFGMGADQAGKAFGYWDYNRRRQNAMQPQPMGDYPDTLNNNPYRYG